MDNLDNQTEEALGWAAEGKKLAVDVPEVSFKDAATFVASMTPIIGDAVAAKEVYDELQKDEPNYYLAGALGGAALIGIIPGLGDVAAKAIKKGAKEVFDVSSNIPKVSRKGTPSYTDSELLEADEIISEWGKGNLSNPELRSKLSDKGFTIETKRISPKMTGDDLEVVGPDGNIVRWKDMPRGSVDRGADAAITKDDKARLFNEGGAVMDEQMEMAFGEAERVDPVSGNDVPPGSLPEEVRDDIPAMLSEGEYVVPADVLRFYGVKFFEDLRNEAKMGLADMEANGRIGGEPVMDEELPFSDEELMSMDMPDTEEVAAAKGGLMGFQEGGFNYPAYIKQPDLSFLGGEQGGTGLDYRTYVNEAGMTITIPFFDGEPMGMIPPGYTPQGEAPAATDDGMGGVTDTGEESFSASAAARGKEAAAKRVEPTINFKDPNSVKGAVSTYYTSSGMLDKVATGVLGLPGLVGSKFVNSYNKKNLIAGIDEALNSELDPNVKRQLEEQKNYLKDKKLFEKAYEQEAEKEGFMYQLKDLFGLNEDPLTPEELGQKYNKPANLSNEDWSKQSTDKWVDATNYVQSLGSDSDPKDWHEAIQAQSEASKEATAAAKAASGWGTEDYTPSAAPEPTTFNN